MDSTQRATAARNMVFFHMRQRGTGGNSAATNSPRLVAIDHLDAEKPVVEAANPPVQNPVADNDE